MKSKYETHIKPNLEAVAAYARAGYIDREIAKVFEIAYSTFCTYKTKYPALKEALRCNKGIADKTIENAAYLSAKGHKVTLKKPFKVRKREYENGKLVSDSEAIEYADEEMYIPPVPSGYIFWLCNRAKEEWRHVNAIKDTGAEVSEISVVYEDEKYE